VSSIVISGAHVVTMDSARAEHRTGYVVAEDNRIVDVGSGPAPRTDGARVVDGRGCLLTPGLVNTHQHLYQFATRGLAVESTLFEWLTSLYPVWAGIDEKVVNVAARAALAWMARSGCTTSTDHHYVFPAGGGDLLAAEIEAARTIGVRFHPCRGSMDRGQSAGGLPPDELVEDRDAVLAASVEAADRWHDPTPGSMVRIALGPCSPFSVTAQLMCESAELARERGLLLHTHLAETRNEEDYCREQFGRSPLEYVEELGWIGSDVWFAHAVHLDDAGIERVGATRTGVAHCPTSNARLGSGIARVSELRAAGASVGLGVDGGASNEAGSVLDSARQALMFARVRGGPAAMTVREALELATLGGASVIGRDDEIGSIEPGKLADLALWRIDGPGHADVADPVVALILGSPPPLELLLVNGSPLVERDRVTVVDEESLAGEVASVHRELLGKVR
jgi:cytosine/adenosine deaminase-related metal-dependent hydrolase